jgi:hypothetical protein
MATLSNFSILATITAISVFGKVGGQLHGRSNRLIHWRRFLWVSAAITQP